MAVACLRRTLEAIDKEGLGSNWTDKAQAVASMAETAALMESGAVPIVAQIIQTNTGASPPTWTWTAGPATEDSVFKWSATLCMWGATPFADGRFEITIDIPEDFPFKPPLFAFKTKVHHPYVTWDGKFSLAELQLRENGGTWDPSKTIPGILDLIGGMLAWAQLAGAEVHKMHIMCPRLSNCAPLLLRSYPESILGHALVPELAGQLRDDKEGFIEAAKKCTVDHAML